MTKKAKATAKKEFTVGIADIDGVEKLLRMIRNAHEYTGDDLKKPKHEWVLVPIQSRRVRQQDEFYEQVIKSRIKLRHDDWDSARNAARKLSEVGGVGEVIIISSKFTVKHSILATFDNGDQVASFQRVEAPRGVR